MSLPTRMIRARQPGDDQEQLRARAAAVQANIDYNVGLAPIQFGDGLGKDEPIAIVGFGPSLRDTWEQLRRYKYIWTVSGAHDFMLARGITPTYHTDVDWQPHKHGFVAVPHADVQYRMCNGIHPAYTEKLRPYRLTMFEPMDMSPKLYKPAGIYPTAPKVGNGGQQAALLAKQDGWAEQHWFGFDHCYGADGATHAGPHLKPKRLPTMKVAATPGGTAWTSDNELLVAAKLLLYLIAGHSLKVRVIGDSLFRDMAEL